MIQWDVSELPEEVVHELAKGQFAKDALMAAQARDRQDLVAWKASKVSRIDGVGDPVASVDPFIYHAWARKFGTYDCWRDKGFRSYMLREHPNMRTQVIKKNILVGYSGESRKRFSKSYQWKPSTM